MIEIAVILLSLAVVVDASIVALEDVKYERARVDRRLERRYGKTYRR